jgi:hypothetical protein
MRDRITVGQQTLPNDKNAYHPEDVAFPSPVRVEQISARSSPEIVGIIDDTAKRYGIKPSTLRRFGQIESGFDPYSISQTGAKGLFQFTPGTAKRYGLQNPFNARQSADAAARLLIDNQNAMTKTLGRVPTDGELYLAHQQGAAGASALLSNPGANVVDALTPAYGGNRSMAMRAITVNGGSPDMTAGDFANKWINKFDGGGGKTRVASAAGTAKSGPFIPDDAQAQQKPARRQVGSAVGLGGKSALATLLAGPGRSKEEPFELQDAPVRAPQIVAQNSVDSSGAPLPLNWQA